MLLVFSPDLWWSRFFFLCPTFGSADLLSPIEMASRNETLESCTPYEKSVYKKNRIHYCLGSQLLLLYRSEPYFSSVNKYEIQRPLMFPFPRIKNVKSCYWIYR